MRTSSEITTESGREEVADSFDSMTAPDRQGLDLAHELFALAELLRSDDRLTRSLADPSRNADERSDLARRVFNNHVDSTCMNILLTLISGDWAHPSDLPSGVEDLGVESVLRAACHVGQISVVCQELGELFQVLLDDRQLRASFSDISPLSAKAQGQLARELFADRLTVWTMILFVQLIARNEHGSLLTSVRRLAARASDLVRTHLVFITVVAPLNDSQHERLVHILEGKLHESVKLMVTVDESLIGGVFINTGVESVDMSLLARFNELKQIRIH